MHTRKFRVFMAVVGVFALLANMVTLRVIPFPVAYQEFVLWNCIFGLLGNFIPRLYPVMSGMLRGSALMGAGTIAFALVTGLTALMFGHIDTLTGSFIWLANGCSVMGALFLLLAAIRPKDPVAATSAAKSPTAKNQPAVAD